MTGRALTVALVAMAAPGLAGCGGDAAPRAETATAARPAPGANEAPVTCGASGPTGESAGGEGAERVRVIPVNRGTHGMSSVVQWMVSPDRCALLVMENPAAVEAEPVVNGALLVSERPGMASVVAVDSAWDVAPSPDWTRLAWGKGWMVSGREADSIPRARWRELAAQVGVDAATLERASWPASGMAYARGGAIAHVRDLRLTAGARSGASADTNVVGEPAPPPALRVGMGGWRVAWRGDTAWFGDVPKGAQDFSPPTVWRRLLPGTRAVVDAPGAQAPALSPWTTGPTLDISVTVPNDSARSIALPHGAVEGRGGTIVLRRANGTERAVGPGIPLAATLGGRFIVALAPAPDAGEFEPKQRLVVYELRD